MKRSEMVQLMARTYALHEMKDLEFASSEDIARLTSLADYVLSSVETAGMIPPLRDRTWLEKAIFGTKEDNFDMGLKKQTWEKE